jgi:hypothetical protein
MLPKHRGAILRDLLATAGAGLASYGAWLAWRPAGFVLAGAFILAGVFLHDRNSEG